MRETHMSSYGSIAPRKIVAILMTAAAALLPTSCGAAVPVASARPAVPTASLSPFAQQRALILGGGGPVGRALERPAGRRLRVVGGRRQRVLDRLGAFLDRPTTTNKE